MSTIALRQDGSEVVGSEGDGVVETHLIEVDLKYEEDSAEDEVALGGKYIGSEGQAGHYRVVLKVTVVDKYE